MSLSVAAKWQNSNKHKRAHRLGCKEDCGGLLRMDRKGGCHHSPKSLSWFVVFGCLVPLARHGRLIKMQCEIISILIKYLTRISLSQHGRKKQKETERDGALYVMACKRLPLNSSKKGHL